VIFSVNTALNPLLLEEKTTTAPLCCFDHIENTSLNIRPEE